MKHSSALSDLQMFAKKRIAAHRYPNDFEAGILAAVNGGGNNMARATLTGALLGAMNGLSGIPERFITGLENSEHLLEVAEIVSRSYPAQEN